LFVSSICRVPNAIEGRDSIKHDILGMAGIPEDESKFYHLLSSCISSSLFFFFLFLSLTHSFLSVSVGDERSESESENPRKKTKTNESNSTPQQTTPQTTSQAPQVSPTPHPSYPQPTYLTIFPYFRLNFVVQFLT
jgi:hypothetical protein